MIFIKILDEWQIPVSWGLLYRLYNYSLTSRDEILKAAINKGFSSVFLNDAYELFWEEDLSKGLLELAEKEPDYYADEKITLIRARKEVIDNKDYIDAMGSVWNILLDYYDKSTLLNKVFSEDFLTNPQKSYTEDYYQGFVKRFNLFFDERCKNMLPLNEK